MTAKKAICSETAKLLAVTSDLDDNTEYKDVDEILGHIIKATLIAEMVTKSQKD